MLGSQVDSKFRVPLVLVLHVLYAHRGFKISNILYLQQHPKSTRFLIPARANFHQLPCWVLR